MIMNQISEDIFKLYNQLEADECQPIDSIVVDEAISIINNSNAEDSKILFLLLSAINLLNAAIKTEKQKSQLFYGFIKTKVSKIADAIIMNPSSYDDTSLFYDSTRKCIYFEVFGVIFSFHQIVETKLIKNIAAKNAPIQWTGIRLQRIAQNLFLYAKELRSTAFDNARNMNSSKSTYSSNKAQASGDKLVPCCDCGNVISSSARFCPHCGSDLNISNELFDGIKNGDSIKITYSGNSNSGVLEARNSHFITLSLADEKWLKVRTAAIDSVELIDTNEFSTELFAQQADAFFLHIFELSRIDKETLISTNSTITQVDKQGLTIIKDSGEIATCVKPGIVGYKKKECAIGKRIYCGNIGTNGRCYNSIVEMPYGALIGFFRKAVSHSQNITQARRAQIMSILTYLMKEMMTNPEVYLEIKKFKKSVKEFLGQLNIKCDNFSEPEEIVESIKESNHNDLVYNNQQGPLIYKTETERLLEGEGLPQPKVLGKNDLEALPGKKKDSLASSTPISVTAPELSKPAILSSDEVSEFINKKLTNLSEAKCKQLEKELDTLIRNGEKEECLRRSYQIINTSRPTPKYLRSYLDRIVNTEIALEHTKEALQSLSFLIVLTEQQEDASANSLGHLYITMARLYLKDHNKVEAQKAILYAENLRPDNNAIKKLKDSIMRLGVNENENNLEGANAFAVPVAQEIVDGNISKMLLQDVEQEAHRQELLPSSELMPAEQLFGKAQNNRNSLSDTYDDKAFSFLEAAAAYYNNKQTDTIMFKISVANYARFKGHGMFTRFSNLQKNNNSNLVELQALRDSACSYYIEALGISNQLGENEHLRELLLKYLQLSFVISQIEGGKTPEPDWESIPLGKLQEICLKGDSSENLNVLLRAYIAVGSAAEDAWDSLIKDKGGIGPFKGKCSTEEKFRNIAYSALNKINQSSICTDVELEEFMHEIFINRISRINNLKLFLHNCLLWGFSTFDISTFETRWSKVAEFEELMTSTDKIVMKSIKEVIDILKPYAGILRENERTKFLVRSQQILLGAQKMVTETATFYGRTFFSHLISSWLKAIAQLLEERYVSTYPKLEITPDPCYIKKNEDGEGVIGFLVTNIGDSTAQSFAVKANINGREYTINHVDELSAGDCCVESFVSKDFLNVEFLDVNFSLTIRYEGKDLPSTKSEATYEIESGDILTDEIQIPWKISNTPKENIFKGREEKLSTLIKHYLSKDRTQTYILYGLTRTGKSSILDYLCERIEGQPLCEDSSKKIKTFKWDFSKISFKNASVADLWMRLLELNIYNKLPENILDVVDKCFPEGKWPDALCQSDLEIMIDALNSCGIIPLVTIDEFSNIRPMLKEGLVDATFISELRDLALKGKACFVYAGTYDIKELPKEKEFGIEGQMTNTRSMHINEIEQVYADELIDACDSIVFVEKAKAYIRSLSGCVPYWIQWICLDCGKYAVAHKKRHLGYRDVDRVVKVLTGEEQPSNTDTWEAMDETNFHNNQISPNNIAEHQLISCISYLIRESTQIERGVSMDELTRLWDKYNVPADKRLNMTRALKNLEEKRVIRQFTDETREVYRLNVDLFRRWWFMHHRDLALEFSL